MKNALLTLSLLISPILHAEFDETIIQAPRKESNEEVLGPTICRTRDHLRWDVCYSKNDDNTETMKSFKFTNYGENVIVPTPGFGVGRLFEFNFEDQARSDLNLLLWDMPDEYESHGHLKMMMFFPRTHLFAINYVSNDVEDLVNVTLPNGELVSFNGKTYEIVSGVLNEGPMAQDKDGNGLEPNVNYTGNGVVVWAHRLNDYPVGVSDSTRKKQTAYIAKKGYPLCKVSASDLWYTDASKGGNVMFNKSYVTDIAFDKYLLKKCKFSMFK